MNVNGTDMQNQSARTATKVPNGIAAEEPSPQRIRFMIKKSANTMLEERQDFEVTTHPWLVSMLLKSYDCMLRVALSQGDI